MTILDRTITAIRSRATAFRERREELRTERIINGLCREIRKDIGWPDGYSARKRR